MHAIEFEAQIDGNGNAHVPREYRSLYGQMARFVVLTPENPQEAVKSVDTMKYSGQMNGSVDGMDDQKQTPDQSPQRPIHPEIEAISGILPAPPARRPGSAKGQLQVLVEDDEHLQDFQEYMP